MNKKVKFDAEKLSGLSKGELTGLLDSWQKKLHMSDWKIDLKIVNFERTNYRQSGDFSANPENKTAIIFLTAKPFRGDEEYTLVHELIHVLLYDYDKYNEDMLLKQYGEGSKEHDMYMEKLEATVHHLAEAILGRGETK